MNGVRTYELRLSLLWRVIFIVAAIMCLSMVADAFDTGDPFTILTSLAFFGFGGFVMLKVMLRNNGTIELTNEGLLLDSYLTTGFISWEQFESAQALRLFGVSYLGLTTSNLQAYIDSRKERPGLKHDGDRALAVGFTRIMMSLLEVLPPARTGINFLVSAFGYAPLPKRFDEKSLLTWNQESYGSQLLIHRMWLPEFEVLLKELATRSLKASTTFGLNKSAAAPEQTRRQDQAATTTPEPNLKLCPMCAERVQVAARICRYCRFSFDDERLLPASS